MAPIVHRLADRDGVEARVCVTAQHRSMLDDALRIFGITPDYDLDIMTPGQTLSGITSAVLQSLDPVLRTFAPTGFWCRATPPPRWRPRWRRSTGRSLSGMSKRGFAPAIWRIRGPRRPTGASPRCVSTRHYCPDGAGAAEPSQRGRRPAQHPRDRQHGHRRAAHDRRRGSSRIAPSRTRWPGASTGSIPTARLILVTGHRRESFGEGFQQICRALARAGRTRRRPNRLSRAPEPERPRAGVRHPERERVDPADRALGLRGVPVAHAARVTSF